MENLHETSDDKTDIIQLFLNPSYSVPAKGIILHQKGDKLYMRLGNGESEEIGIPSELENLRLLKSSIPFTQEVVRNRTSHILREKEYAYFIGEDEVIVGTDQEIRKELEKIVSDGSNNAEKVIIINEFLATKP